MANIISIHYNPSAGYILHLAVQKMGTCIWGLHWEQHCIWAPEPPCSQPVWTCKTRPTGFMCGKKSSQLQPCRLSRECTLNSIVYFPDVDVCTSDMHPLFLHWSYFLWTAVCFVVIQYWQTWYWIVIIVFRTMFAVAGTCMSESSRVCVLFS